MEPFVERVDAATRERYWMVSKRGESLLDDPILNKGTCFSEEERDTLALRGLLPPGVATEEEQRARAYENFQRSGNDVKQSFMKKRKKPGSPVIQFFPMQ